MYLKRKKQEQKRLIVNLSNLFICPFELFHLYCSNKDDELLKTYKNVYSKLLRAEKNAPLVSRVELYVELLQQLMQRTGSDDTGTRKP